MQRLHVDEMLQELDPEEADEWFAYYTIEPWGDEWRRTGTVSAAVDRGFESILCGLAGESMERVPKPTDYMPRLVRRDEKPKPKRIRIDLGSIDRLAQQLERQVK